jgi:hypothetical protein
VVEEKNKGDAASSPESCVDFNPTQHRGIPHDRGSRNPSLRSWDRHAWFILRRRSFPLLWLLSMPTAVF